MGAYLSQPKKDKISSDESNNYIACGASSMQGWRVSQEDAHNCILDFDADTSFFAVYDGHGGAEVALYCAEKLPDFLKKTEAYRSGEFVQALQDAFLGFDSRLTQDDVREELLKLIVPEKLDDESETDDDCELEDDEDLNQLHDEGRMPLKDLLDKYTSNNKLMMDTELVSSDSAIASGSGSGSGSSSSSGTSRSIRPGGRAGGSATGSGSSNPRQARRPVEIEDDFGVSSSSSTKVRTPVNETPAVSVNLPSASSSSASNNEAGQPNTNGPSSISSTAIDTTIHCTSASIPFTDKPNCNSPDSSSATQPEIKVTAAPESSSECTSEASSRNHTINGDLCTTTASGSNDCGSASSSQENEISTNSTKTESVSSSDSSASVEFHSNRPQENGEVTSNTAGPVGNISSTNSKQTGSADPMYYDSSSTDDEDVKFDEEEDSWSTEDGIDNSEDTEEEEEDDEDEEDEDGESADFFLSNMQEGPGLSSGCTAVVALLRGNELYVANAGDSRCVVSRNGTAVEMSFDHKPEDTIELNRIRAAGGRVTNDGRVNGGLNLSRAIGDHAYKMNNSLPAKDQMISALPDVKQLTITPEDEFIVLACDGIWNYMSSSEVVDFVRTRLTAQEKLSKICEELFDHCLAPNTMGDGTGCDNMTAVIVKLKDGFAASKITSATDTGRKRPASPLSEADSGLQEDLKRQKTDSSSPAPASIDGQNDSGINEVSSS